jgi:CBS domain-containing protein
MSCQTIMDANPPVLREHDVVSTAMDLMLSHRMLSLPVVDANRTYLGMFAKSRLFGLLLPTVVALEDSMPRFAHLPDFHFMPEQLGYMQERYRAIAEHKVGQYADPTVPVVHPDDPVSAAVLILFRIRNFVPVVDAKTKRLMGLISTWQTLTRIREGAVSAKK